MKELRNELLAERIKLQNAITELQNKVDAINVLVDCEDEFVLPEKWCVLRNRQNYKVINNYFRNPKNNKSGHFYDGCSSYLTSSHINSKEWIWIYDKTPEGYTEITFEQFKKYVLNK